MKQSTPSTLPDRCEEKKRYLTWCHYDICNQQMRAPLNIAVLIHISQDKSLCTNDHDDVVHKTETTDDCNAIQTK